MAIGTHTVESLCCVAEGRVVVLGCRTSWAWARCKLFGKTWLAACGGGPSEGFSMAPVALRCVLSRIWRLGKGGVRSGSGIDRRDTSGRGVVLCGGGGGAVVIGYGQTRIGQ